MISKKQLVYTFIRGSMHWQSNKFIHRTEFRNQLRRKTKTSTVHSSNGPRCWDADLRQTSPTNINYHVSQPGTSIHSLMNNLMLPEEKFGEESIFWANFDLSVSVFCHNCSTDVLQDNTLMNTLVGEELEWFGAHGLLVVVNKLVEIELENRILEQRCSATESSVEAEVTQNRNLRRQLTNVQRTVQDTEWRLQEQIATLNNTIHQEKTVNVELRERIASLTRSMDTSNEHNIHGDTSSVGEGSPATTTSVMTTPASWRERSRYSGGSSSSWNGNDSSSRSQSDKLLRIAEKLNITPNGDSGDL